MEHQKAKEAKDTMASLAGNKFIGSETLEEFIGKNDGSFRPHKKIFFERKPDKQDRRDLLYQYLREIKDREQNKLQEKKDDDQLQQERLAEIAEEIRRDLDKNKEEKASKISKMRGNIAEVKAEREAVVNKEIDYRMMQKPITKFPYTHGDTVEAARAQIRGEMIQDLKNRDAIRESMAREKFENSGVGNMFRDGLPPNIEKEI